MILAVKELSSTTAGHRHITRSQARFGLSRLSAEIGTARFRVPISKSVHVIEGGEGYDETRSLVPTSKIFRVGEYRRYDVLTAVDPVVRGRQQARLGTASGSRSAGILMLAPSRHVRPKDGQPLDARLFSMPRQNLPSAPKARKSRVPGHRCKLPGRAELDKAPATNPAPTYPSCSILGKRSFSIHCRLTMPRP